MWIAGNHPQLQLTGRFEETASGSLRCGWPGSQITLRFNGTAVEATLRDLSKGDEGNFLAIQVDEKPPVTLALKQGYAVYRLAENLTSAEHTIRLFKQTEASVGMIELEGFSLPDGTILPPAPNPERRIEFIGDSITCGYGNESSNPEESFKPSTENHYLSYGQLTARKLGAEAHMIAWSGEGILRNAQGEIVHPLPSIYSQTLPPSPSPAWDFSRWIPHAVVINLGTNDFLTGIPDQEEFVETYFQLLEKLNRHYYSPHIFCCLGPMITDASPEGENRLSTARRYFQVIETRARRNGIVSIHRVEFPALQLNEFGADFHPNLVAHRRMAKVLTEDIRQEIHW